MPEIEVTIDENTTIKLKLPPKITIIELEALMQKTKIMFKMSGGIEINNLQKKEQDRNWKTITNKVKEQMNQGKSLQKIAKELDISYSTLYYHISGEAKK